jgi:hypothetical protein
MVVECHSRSLLSFWIDKARAAATLLHETTPERWCQCHRLWLTWIFIKRMLKFPCLREEQRKQQSSIRKHVYPLTFALAYRVLPSMVEVTSAR